MRRAGPAFLGVVLLSVTAVAGPDAPAATGEIVWQTSFVKGLAQAKESGRPIFVAVNNVTAEGEGVEVASKLLREEVYTDPKIVELAKEFVCVLLRSPVSTEDGGELRVRYDIEGMIVTPQHLFLHADGSLTQRKEYWSYRDKESSVEALATMMDRALKAHAVRGRLPARGADAASRTAWIAAAVDIVRAGPDVALRTAAARELLTADVGNDCLEAMQSVLLGGKEPTKEDAAVFTEVVRVLGRPGLESAVRGLCAMLEVKDAGLRGNAAVSLEYVGSATAVEALLKRAAKEKDEAVRSHVLRALGRCGAKQEAVRKALLKESAAKSDLVAAGAIVGLAYFERDADVARGLERTLKANDDGLRRIAVLWTLAQVGDARTVDILRAKLAETAEVLPSHRLIDAAVAASTGSEGRKAELEQSLRWYLREKTPRTDTARYGRGNVEFVPKADAATSSS